MLKKLPKGEKDEHLLVGYDSRDDAAVYQLTEDMACVQTLDFFPPMVTDPYTFGQIAAANAMSDIYAMGGVVKTALNIVCFPEHMDLNILGEIMRGGAEKVMEAGGTLAGGHSIADKDIKYGLSVTGIVHPKHILTNNTAKPGDQLILTKKLGTGIVCAANRVGKASEHAMASAAASMTTLNKEASEVMVEHDRICGSVHACTDVTGFGLLGHLHEMMDGQLSCILWAGRMPVLPEAVSYAEGFLTTGGGQKNRNYVGANVRFDNVSSSMEEILFDPQTSGGLLVAVDPADSESIIRDLMRKGLPARLIGEVTERTELEILVKC